MSLTRDEILRANDLPAPKAVPVPEWGGEVYVRMLTVGERGEWETEAFDESGKPKLDARTMSLKTLVRMLCNENGIPVFQESDIKALSGKNPDVVERVTMEAVRFNGLDFGSAETSEKNSRKATKRGSGMS